jgi:flagellin
MTKIRGSQTSMMSIRESRKSQKELEKSSRKLASGSRIVSASDDAAGQSSAVSSEAKKRGKIQASRNANDAISMLQIMEGGMNEMGEMIVRVRELTITAASDSVTDVEREMLDLEAGGLIREINRIAQTSNYLDQNLLVGDQRKLKIQIDTNSSQNDSVYIDLKDMAQTPFALGIADVSISQKHRAKSSMVKLDYALNSLTESRAKIGGTLKRLSSTTSKLANDIAQESKVKSGHSDVDYASETAKQTSNKIQAESSQAVLAQSIGGGMDYMKLIG